MLVNSLIFAPLFNAPKKHFLKQAVICAALGRLHSSLWKWDIASVFFNVHIVSKSPAELSPPICAFMEMRSNANLPCLVNLAHKVILKDIRSNFKLESYNQWKQISQLRNMKSHRESFLDLRPQCDIKLQTCLWEVKWQYLKIILKSQDMNSHWDMKSHFKICHIVSY